MSDARKSRSCYTRVQHQGKPETQQNQNASNKHNSLPAYPLTSTMSDNIVSTPAQVTPSKKRKESPISVPEAPKKQAKGERTVPKYYRDSDKLLSDSEDEQDVDEDVAQEMIDLGINDPISPEGCELFYDCFVDCDDTQTFSERVRPTFADTGNANTFSSGQTFEDFAKTCVEAAVVTFKKSFMDDRKMTTILSGLPCDTEGEKYFQHFVKVLCKFWKMYFTECGMVDEATRKWKFVKDFFEDQEYSGTHAQNSVELIVATLKRLFSPYR
jgi:hypothetical protein